MHDACGPHASSTHAVLHIREASRAGETIRFRLYAEGLPKDAVYSLVAWPVTQAEPSVVLQGVTLDSTGMAICAGKRQTCGSADRPDDPVDVPVLPVPGEPLRLGLVSSDGASKSFAKIVPVPLHGEDRGCTIDATRLTPATELLWIEGSGFPANAGIAMDGDSEGERHVAKGTTDDAGHYATAILPFKQGLQRGTIHIVLRGAKCAPSTDVRWGRGNY